MFVKVNHTCRPGVYREPVASLPSRHLNCLYDFALQVHAFVSDLHQGPDEAAQRVHPPWEVIDDRVVVVRCSDRREHVNVRAAVRP